MLHNTESGSRLLPRLVTIWIAGLSSLMLSATLYGQDPAAEVLTEKMLDRIGGRAAWAAMSNTVNGSQQNRKDQPTVVYSVITIDFERPRFRIETMAQGLHLIRVIDGNDNSWRLRRSGNIEDVPEALFTEDMAWYQAHLYRTIHRLADRDPVLSVRLWLKLDADGEPYAFGTYEDENGSLSGPWDVIKDGIHHPRWVSNADGTWRAAIKSLELNVPLHPSVFARPDGD